MTRPDPTPQTSTRTTTTTTPETITTRAKNDQKSTTQQTQNNRQNLTTRTTTTKIRERCTPRHHDLLVIVPGPDGPIGCAICALVLDLECTVIDCGVGPEHRSCHDEERSSNRPAVHTVAVASC